MAKGRSNQAYWIKRFASLEDAQHRRGADFYKNLQDQFHRASNSIQMDVERWYGRLADNNDLSYAGAKKLLKKNELEEFRWTVEQYIKAGEENAVDGRWKKELENASARHHISYLEAMELQIQQHAELLSAKYEKGVSELLCQSYAEGYYRTAYEIARGTGVGSNLARLDTRKIDRMIRKPWAQDGASFSDRIWTNKKKLVNTLHTELTQSVIRGTPPRQVIESLAGTMEAGRAQAGRLVMTETAAISAAAEKDCFSELGVERYQIVAALDSSTCDICQDLDGKIFEQKDFVVGVTAHPFHPNCRCTEIPYFDDEFTAGNERASRGADGKTYYVPAEMKYPEWKKQFVGEENNSLANAEKPDIIKKNKGKLKMNLQFFAESDIKNQNSGSLKRAIRKYKKRIEEHEEYLQNPEKHCKDWDKKHIREQEGLKRHWDKEIKNFNNSIRDREEELKKRGDYDDGGINT